MKRHYQACSPAFAEVHRIFLINVALFWALRLGQLCLLPLAEFVEARVPGRRAAPRFKPGDSYAPVMDAAWYPVGGP